MKVVQNADGGAPDAAWPFHCFSVAFAASLFSLFFSCFCYYYTTKAQRKSSPKLKYRSFASSVLKKHKMQLIIWFLVLFGVCLTTFYYSKNNINSKYYEILDCQDVLLFI
jgi:hypothetical protein